MEETDIEEIIVPEQSGQSEIQIREKKKPGFGAGLGIGLCIGAIVLLITLLIVGLNDRKEKAAISQTVLDEATRSKINLLEQSINQYYYDYKDDEITQEDLRTGIYNGMIDALDDPYSEYFTAEELEEQLNDTQGIYYGIGAYISLDDTGYPCISGIIKNTPADESELREDDLIIKIEDESTFGWELEEVVSKIKGEEGTTVHLTIYRTDGDEYLEMDIVRARVESQTVSSEILEDNIGYIAITEFDAVTVNQFAEQYQELLNQNITGLIIDLRGNPGGLVNSVLEIGRQILPEGLIVYTEDKNGKRQEYGCDGKNEIQIPLVVLINGYSASASEILSGAIKDYGIGTLVGTTSYGKGIVQDTHFFSDGSAIKLTERAYFTPNGNYIQGTGIEPDVLIEFDVDKYYDEGIDNQLEKAKEVIRGEK